MSAPVQAVFLQRGDIVPVFLYAATSGRPGVVATLAPAHRRAGDAPVMNAAVAYVVGVETVTDEQVLLTVQINGHGELDITAPSVQMTEIRSTAVDWR